MIASGRIPAAAAAGGAPPPIAAVAEEEVASCRRWEIQNADAAIKIVTRKRVCVCVGV